ncbi:hypothetical protein GCM10023189_56900 [Nibrella saemangeumensis]|uniref:Prokaryotic glutathione synthetase ATP-binding domain-containing protein n=1 Tax=Nibrella saemangeumensis TaxID=1084526 RepID=A0ABP8NM83_9BACT
MKIAYICYEDIGTYASPVENEDQKLFQFLKQKGLDIHFMLWTDPLADWSHFDLALLKAPWDYFEKIDLFYAWLEELKQKNVPLLNPYEVVRWNSDKHYLRDIAAAGLPVTPTLFVEKGHKADLAAYFDQFNSVKLIVKPCISAGSKNTYAITPEQLTEFTPKLNGLLQQESFMVQPFLPQIQEEGEWSLLFFNGRFSHAVLKKAKAGDFRVQHYLGGTIHPQPPSAELIQHAEAYVHRFAKDCLYARVDGTLVDGQFVLMELELIEPFLFLFTDLNSYERYFKALQQLTVSSLV